MSITEIKVRGYHTDMFGHVNHARYIEFLEEGRWAYMEEKDLMEGLHDSGVLHAVVHIDIHYRNSARLGGILQIETSLAKRGSRSFTMSQRVSFKDTGAPIVDAEVTNVFIESSTGKPFPITDEVIRIWPDLGKVKKAKYMD